ncbi:2-hydroxychromene-2-carboxylate isomerase [Parvibaculum sp.]|uniref:2-hydroxychromene-2-carboxylate isomerase n=1 Tax=Parvibaculum sp. TaxID=2024848 RepID=UPI00272170AF|nr:2-hydroxychromene-2-carboxylate isomerase [Parvibaculum sp.]MDO9127303.1 2-hydroxychromene-2-carboxylate isomerase [Parvibaculum sp.]MDP1626088.1 2-hydroxychromene-2-carboxylate isomerase [Parvibaculum sp.]MDP2151405.1 2-hydroxychromene-2-carboxylate isomerase [Parvibaculum sp.]MDP3329265.1 2-hydroxychromene-2-carboxylate isomerase [Parvibaculum sp.]
MTKKVEFLFDFGSPNAYLASKALPAIEQRTGARFQYVPVLLGGIFKATGNVSPVIAEAGIKNKPEYGMLEIQRFIKKHGLTKFKFNSHFPVNTLQIMRGAVAAEMDGVLPKYFDVVAAAMWEDSKKMDDADVIKAVLDAGGIDGAHILARIQEPDVKAKLVANTEDAVNRGAFGIPTFFVDGEIYFGKDRLRDVEEAIAG